VAVGALTAGLAGATFVKTPGGGFFAPPRSDAATSAREAPAGVLAPVGVPAPPPVGGAPGPATPVPAPAPAPGRAPPTPPRAPGRGGGHPAPGRGRRGRGGSAPGRDRQHHVPAADRGRAGGCRGGYHRVRQAGDALQLQVPVEARRMRAILLEMERLYNHIGD